MRFQHRESGIALIVTLWGTALLSVLVALIAQTARLQVREATLRLNQLEARSAAESAIFETAYQLTLNAQRSSASITIFRPLPNVVIEDETGKIDLNTTDPIETSRLLATLVGRDLAMTIVDRIVDWRDPDDTPGPHGAEKASYRQAGLPFEPRNNQFKHVDEIFQVLGVSAALGNTLRRLMTIHSRRAQIDISVAPKQLRDAAFASRLVDSPTQNARPDGQQLGKAYLIKATRRVGSVQTTASATLILTGRADEPYRVVDWAWESAS